MDIAKSTIEAVLQWKKQFLLASYPHALIFKIANQFIIDLVANNHTFIFESSGFELSQSLRFLTKEGLFLYLKHISLWSAESEPSTNSKYPPAVKSNPSDTRIMSIASLTPSYAGRIFLVQMLTY